jgi:hypothetical protein
VASGLRHEPDPGNTASLKLRRLGPGVAAAGIYLLVAGLGYSGGAWVLRPIFDSAAPPPPYRWLKPPAELAADNIRAQGYTKTVPLTPSGSAETSVTTVDGQASLVLPKDSISPSPGQADVVIEMSPRDPLKIGPPPRGMVFDGNAYEVKASYKPSGEPAHLSGAAPVSLVLRYPIHANKILRWNGSAWETLKTTVAGPSLQVFSNIDDFGVFVAGGPPRPPSSGPGTTPWWAYALAGGGLVLVAAAAIARNRGQDPGQNGRAPGPGRGAGPQTGSGSAKTGESRQGTAKGGGRQGARANRGGQRRPPGRSPTGGKKPKGR